ncbi:MAG: hypothetical protein JJU45_11395 [Acidimicrobiia bacterium]|nr:hypothetical protein [Acidimicrobiia bacterium]
MAISTFLLLQLALVSTGATAVIEPGSTDAAWTAAAAGVAFLLGGFVTGSSAMWRGIEDGILHGVVLWAVALVALLLVASFGSGLALGALDPTDTFEDVVLVETADPQATDTEVTVTDVREAAGWALLALVVGLAATTVGSTLGAMARPVRRDVDLRDGVGSETTLSDRSTDHR